MGRRKRKSPSTATPAIEGPLCSACQLPYALIYSKIPRCLACKTSSRHTVCDSCLHRHIFASISKDITSKVNCPEQGCNTYLMNDTIQTTLALFGYANLWEEYLLKSNWFGTTEQWIKRFSVKCPGCQVPIEKNGGCDRMVCRQLQDKMNPFGGNPFGGGGGLPPQFSGSIPQQGFGQFGSGGGFYNGAPFQGGNAFPGGSFFPPPGFPAPPVGGQFGQGSGFPPGPGGGQFGQGSGFPPGPGGGQFGQGSGFPSPRVGGQFGQGSGFPPPPVGGQFGQGGGFPPGPGGFGYQQPPYAPSFPPGQQPPYAPSFPSGQQPPFGNPNYFGSGAYGRPRSRRSSRHRSKSRHRHSGSSSSSSDDHRNNRGSPFGGHEHPYNNLQPFPNMPPVSPRGGGSPVIPPRRPLW